MKFVGMDVHHKTIMTASFSQDGKKIMGDKKILANPQAIKDFFALLGHDEPVTATMEATGFWYWVAETLEEIDGVTVKLANPHKARIIAESNMKSDKVDAAALAHLTRTNFLPESRMLSREARLIRERLRCRISIVCTRTTLKNRVASILRKRGLTHPFSDLFGKDGRAWLASLDLPDEYRANMGAYLRLIDHADEEVDILDKWLAQMVKTTREAQLLTTIPGVGKFIAMLFLAEIGDVKYFKSPRKMAAYAGFAPVTRQSGEKRWTGALRPDCNKYIRWAAIEAVTKAVRVVPAWKEQYDKICSGDAAKKPVARAAIGNKIVKAAWRVLATGEPFNHIIAGRQRNHKDSPTLVTGLK